MAPPTRNDGKKKQEKKEEDRERRGKEEETSGERDAASPGEKGGEAGAERETKAGGGESERRSEREGAGGEKEKWERERGELIDQLRRLQAEFENYKKRIEKERGEFSRYVKGEVIAKLLPVIDNFELALNSCDEKRREERFYKGVELIYAQLMEVLEKEGVRTFNPIGERFDPYKHEAMLSEESEREKNTIIEVLQKGYTLHDKVLRTAKVKVAR